MSTFTKQIQTSFVLKDTPPSSLFLPVHRHQQCQSPPVFPRERNFSLGVPSVRQQHTARVLLLFSRTLSDRSMRVHLPFSRALASLSQRLCLRFVAKMPRTQLGPEQNPRPVSRGDQQRLGFCRLRLEQCRVLRSWQVFLLPFSQGLSFPTYSHCTKQIFFIRNSFKKPCSWTGWPLAWWENGVRGG